MYFLPILLIGIGYCWIVVIIIQNHEKNVMKKYWQRESEANNTRMKDISNLHYITIPLEKLPFIKNFNDLELNSLQETIETLAAKKIVNLSEYSNTDLKLMYGVGNLERLSEFDENYTLLIRSIYKWANSLQMLDYIDEAIDVLEYGLTLETNISAHYILLGKLYAEQNNWSAFDLVLKKANSLNSMTKNNAIQTLEEIQQTLDEEKPQ